ncbi:MAG: hypothetical protein WA009_12510, partial [Phototrophicaceae bacterium]
MFTSPTWLILLVFVVAIPFVERVRARRRRLRGAALGTSSRRPLRLLWLGGLAAVIVALANP